MLKQSCLFVFLIYLTALTSITVALGRGQWWNHDFREESDDYIANQQQQQEELQEQQQLQRKQLQHQQKHQLETRQLDGRRRSRNSKSKSSHIPVGDICDPTDPMYNTCSGNSNCVYFDQENVYKCNCSYSYEITSSKKCLRSWGHYCDAKDPCNHEAFLSCIDNRCECENSEVYQNSPDRCTSKVGGPCSTSAGPECVSNALCLSFDRYGRKSRCICRDGFVETSDALCMPGVGMPCNGKGECNSEIPLVCKEGICSCREAVHAYDSETNSCVGLVGAQCCTNFDGVDCPHGITNGCVSGAYCKKTSKSLPGRCACQSYNLESDERTCSENPTFGVAIPGKVY